MKEGLSTFKQETFTSLDTRLQNKLDKLGLELKWSNHSASFKRASVGINDPQELLEDPKLLQRTLKEGFDITVSYGPWDRRTSTPRYNKVRLYLDDEDKIGQITWKPRYTPYKRRIYNARRDANVIEL